ncbi:MAG: acyl-CoA dehydrogenase family protein [Actinomycetota bacterium]
MRWDPSRLWQPGAGGHPIREGTMLDTIRTHADATEAAGRLAPSSVAALVDHGAFKLWVPEAYGGAGADLQAGLDAMAEVGRADGAAGWCVMIANTTALLSARLAPEVAADVFAAPDAVAGGFAAPVGVATLDGDGARVTGEWAWGSGSSHATTMGGGVRVVDADGSPSTLPDGGRIGFAFFDQVELLDTWQVSGLQGTHSTDYRVDDVAVPFERIVSMDRRTLVVDEPLYRFSTFGALALGVAMTMVGLAERAVEELTHLAAKVPQGSTKGLAHRAPVQADLARSIAAVRGARAYVADEVGRAWDEVVETGRVTDERKVALRLAANAAAEASIAAVDRCYTAAGGEAVYRRSPLQRVFRDVHVASQHAMVASRVFEPLGRFEFGLETDTNGL